MNLGIYIWWVSIFKLVGIIFANSCILLLESDGWFDPPFLFLVLLLLLLRAMAGLILHSCFWFWFDPAFLFLVLLLHFCF